VFDFRYSVFDFRYSVFVLSILNRLCVLYIDIIYVGSKIITNILS
jgi:hypothetical protein